jgi:hypothetical protein
MLALGAAVGAIWLCGGTFVVSQNQLRAQDMSLPGTKPLADISTEELGPYAIAHVRSLELSAPGTTPQVAHVQQSHRDEHEQLGLGYIGWLEADTLVTLAILQGTFHPSPRAGAYAAGPVPYRYLALFFNTESGGWFQWQVSRHGAQFRRALNDPTLPSADATKGL